MKKKLLISIIGLSMVVSLIGCQGNNSTNEKEYQNVSTTQEEEKAESKNNSDSEKPDDELSQAEWVQKYASEEGTEDGYKIVDKINITYDDISISFDHTENYTKTDGSQITFVYFNFVNNSNLEACPATYFNTSAFQNEESIGFSQEVYLSDVHGGERHNNYINTINPGETVTVRMAFKVPEEKLNEMYFTLSNYGGSHFYDETSLQLGYVDIRQ